MKFGVKTYDQEKFLDKFIDSSDFFEVQAIRGNDYSFLTKYDKEIVIHCEHANFGVNISDSSKDKFNLDAINFARGLADSVNCKKIVVHPGLLQNENCSVENTINFLKDNYDSRFCVENMPFLSREKKKVGSTPEEIKRIMVEAKVGFCFDINHAIESASTQGEDYWNYLKKFEKLKPNHYHLGGEKMDVMKSHFSFCDSDLDLGKVFDILETDTTMTLEVSLDDEKIKEDLKVVRGFR